MDWRVRGSDRSRGVLHYNILEEDGIREVVFTNSGDREVTLALEPDKPWIKTRILHGRRGLTLPGKDSLVVEVAVTSDSLSFQDSPHHGNIIVHSEIGQTYVPLAVTKATPASILKVDIEKIAFDTSDRFAKTFRIRNEGNKDLGCGEDRSTSACILADKPWLSVAPRTLPGIAPGDSLEVSVSVDRTDPALFRRMDSASIAIESDGGTRDIRILVDNRGPVLKVDAEKIELKAGGPGAILAIANAGIGEMDFAVLADTGGKLMLIGQDSGFVSGGRSALVKVVVDTASLIRNENSVTRITVHSRTGGQVAIPVFIEYRDTLAPSGPVLRERRVQGGLFVLRAPGHWDDSVRVDIASSGANRLDASLHRALQAPVPALEADRTTVTLRWPRVKYAQQYVVFRGETADFTGGRLATLVDTLYRDTIPPLRTFHYRVAARNPYGTGSPSVGPLAGKLVPYPPRITTQPASALVAQGQNHAFEVAAEGYGPLEYRWHRNSVPLPGETGASLRLHPVGDSDDGALFSVSVGNVYDTVFSTPALLTLGRVPQILVQPSDITVQEGNAARFQVGIGAGTAPLAYKWHRNGVAIPGATASSLELPGVSFTADNQAIFHVEVSNAFGAIQSRQAVLTVGAPPRIVTVFPDFKVATGGAIRISVAVQGSQPLAYAWEKGGVVATTLPELSISPAAPAHSGRYKVIVSNAFGQSASNDFTLTVGDGPSILAQPRDTAVLEGTAAAFSVSARGLEPLRYQWYRDDQAMAGMTGATLVLESVAASLGGSAFKVRVGNEFAEVMSEAAILVVGNKPVFLSELTDRNVARGLPFSLALEAGGSAPLSYSLAKDGQVVGTGAMEIPSKARTGRSIGLRTSTS